MSNKKEALSQAEELQTRFLEIAKRLRHASLMKNYFSFSSIFHFFLVSCVFV
jgi:hypothetical protein